MDTNKGQNDMDTEIIIRKNDKVRVIKGRKFPIGTEGTVFWTAATTDAYGVWKIGVITTTGEKIYINDANVELVEAAPVNPNAPRPVFHVGGGFDRQPVMVFSGMAKTADGALPMHECVKCGRALVHVTSARTGNKYWAEVMMGRYNEYYNKAALHTAEQCKWWKENMGGE
jgi:hypothetical protein